MHDAGLATLFKKKRNARAQYLLKEIQCSFKVLQTRVDHAAVIVVTQEVLGIVCAVLFADVHHVQLQEGNCRLEAFC